MSDSARLLGKAIIVALPSMLLVGAFILHARSGADVRHAVLEDKIDKLILSDTHPRVIAAGDSRAQTGFVPAVFTAKTGLDSANIAIGSGMLEEAYDALTARHALVKGRILIVSVTSDQISDYDSEVLPINPEVAANAPLDFTTLRFYMNYYNSLLQFQTDDFQRFARGDFSPDKTQMDDTTLQRKGFQPRTDTFDPAHLVWLDATPQWYIDTDTDGLRLQDFLRGINGFGHSDVTVVLYKGPIAPAWRPILEGTKGAAVEAHFDDIVRNAIAPYPNMHFIDFSEKDIPSLGNTQFADIMHLNENGAIIFTEMLVSELRQEHIVK